MTVNEPTATELRTPAGRSNGLIEAQLKPLRDAMEEVSVSVGGHADVSSHPLLDGDIYSIENSPRDGGIGHAALQQQEPSSIEKAMAEAARARLYGQDSSLPMRKPRPASAPVLPSGPEPTAIDIHYLSRCQVQALHELSCSVPSAMESCFTGLQSKDWQEVISALNKLRQLSVHHPAFLKQHLPAVIPLLLKNVRSLRSSVCKTALLCLSDLSQDFGDELLSLIDIGGMESPSSSMLAQLLLKAGSNDKRFVIEEAERCLAEFCKNLSAIGFHSMMLPYVQHRNPKVRGIAGACIAAVLPRLDLGLLPSGGLARHLKSAGDLIIDKTPQAREAARTILVLVRNAFDASKLSCQATREGFKIATGPVEEDQIDLPTPWELFCRQELTFAAATAVLKAAA